MTNTSRTSRVLAAVETITALVMVSEDEDPRDRLERLFERHHLRLYRFALRMTRGDDEALDLVQEAFVRAAGDHRKVPPGDAEAGAWLVRVLVNLLHDRYRRAQVRRAFRIGHVPEAQRDFTEAIDARSAVRAAIAQLPPRQRAIVVLHELDERSIAEIASELGLAAVTVRWHLSTARKRLAQLLEGIPK